MFGPAGIMGDMENAFALKRVVEKANAVIDRANSTLSEKKRFAAVNVGLRYAATRQLDRLDPHNPLLQSDELAEAIADASYRAFLLAGEQYEACRVVGRTFKIPGREGPVPSPNSAVAAAPVAPAPAVPVAPVAPVSILSHPQYIALEQSYAASLAMRSALSEVLRQVDENHPLLKNFMLMEKIRKAGVTAFVMGKKDYNAARSAGESFVLPGTEGALEKNRPQE